MEYSRLRGEAGSDISLVDLGFQTDLRVYLHLRQTWMAFSELGHLPPPHVALWETLEGLGGTPKKFTLSFYRNHLIVCYFIFKSISFLITFNF